MGSPSFPRRALPRQNNEDTRMCDTKKTRAMLLFAVLSAGMLSGCTDAQKKQITSLGSAAEVVCYSGGKEIYRGRSTGKSSTEKKSDGWFFEEEGSGKLIRLSGDCVIRN